jgi:hypothetical protein
MSWPWRGGASIATGIPSSPTCDAIWRRGQVSSSPSLRAARHRQRLPVRDVPRRRLSGHGVRACLYLDREDEEPATEVFIAALPEVAGDGPAWDREDVFLDAELLAQDRHPWPIPTVGDDDRFGPLLDPTGPLPAGEEEPTGEYPTLSALGLAPIAGGSPSAEDEAWWRERSRPEPTPYVPTAADLAEMRANRDATECLYGYE